MVQKQQNKDPAFFAVFKEWVSANNGVITDRLYERSKLGDQCRGITIEPATKPVATALFIHGTGNDIIYPSISLYKFLFKQGIRIVAFDLDGHGQQGTTLLSQKNAESYLSWAIEQTSAVAEEPLFIIGHSLGGTLALSYASKESKNLHGLILISAPLALSANLVSLALETLSCLRPSIWQERKNYGSWGILPALGPFKRTYYPIRLKDHDSNYVKQVNDTIKAQSLADKLDSISCPVLLVYGTGDHIVNARNAFDIQKRVKSSELVLIKGATHFSTIFESVVPEKISTFIRANIR